MKSLESKFDKIYRDNYPKVIRLCLGYVNGDSMLAKDLTQEVFIKVWEHLDSFRNESSLSTWIYRITVNTCLTSFRGKRIVNISNNLQNLENEEYSESLADDKSLKIKQLYSCINTLNQDNKSIILLELEGLPQKDIAEVMGLTHEAIRVRVHRIKNELTKCVKK
jgi:RNA polymerase sigma-70 factor (ECF subfamily)